MSKDNKKEEALKKLIGDKSNIRQEYGSYMSHYHCWHQNQYPACGIPLENHKQYHKQCCLCDTPSPTPSNKEEKCQHEIESNMCEPYCRKCKISLPSTPNQNNSEWEERIKEFIYGSDIDWNLSLKNEGITYLKTWQLHKRVEDLILSIRKEVLEEVKRDINWAIIGTTTREKLVEKLDTIISLIDKE